MATPPCLILAYGNRSRGDDALGGLFLDAVAPGLDPARFELLEDFQLNIEHSYDIIGRELVLLVDAAANQSRPFCFKKVAATKDLGYTSHAMSPDALLGLCHQLALTPIPPVFLLAIAGQDFTLGEPLTAVGQTHLEQAIAFANPLIERPDANFWQQSATIAS